MKVCFHDGVISQFEGYEALEELDWDDYRRRYPRHEPPRPDPRGRGRQPQPLQARQAGRRHDALLRALGRRAGRHPRAARLPVRPRPDPPDDRVLRPADLARVDASAGSSMPGSMPASTGSESWKIFLDVLDLDLHDKAARDDPRGHPPRGDGRVARPAPARLRRRRDQGRGAPPPSGHPPELRSLAFQVRYRRHLVDIEVTTERAIVRVGMSDERPLELEVEGNAVLPRAGPTSSTSGCSPDPGALSPGPDRGTGPA